MGKLPARLQPSSAPSPKAELGIRPADGIARPRMRNRTSSIQRRTSNNTPCPARHCHVPEGCFAPARPGSGSKRSPSRPSPDGSGTPPHPPRTACPAYLYAAGTPGTAATSACVMYQLPCPRHFLCCGSRTSSACPGPRADRPELLDIRASRGYCGISAGGRVRANRQEVIGVES